MSEKRGRAGRSSGYRRVFPKHQRCGLNHYLWAHGYRVRHKRGLWMIVAGNSSVASRAEGAIYQTLSAKKEAGSERDVR